MDRRRADSANDVHPVRDGLKMVRVAARPHATRVVELGADGTLEAALPGVEVLEQQADPDVPEYGTEEALASAVGVVTWEDRRWFVLLVRFSGEDALTTVAASKAAGAETLDQFAAFLDDKADEGGMR